MWGGVVPLTFPGRSGKPPAATRPPGAWVVVGWGRTPAAAPQPRRRVRYRRYVIRGIDHAQIAAPPGCEAAARAFFGELLGLPEVAKPPALAPRGGVWFALPDGRELHVGVEAAFSPQDKAHVALAVASADELAALAARLGGSIDRETIPGTARFHAPDPWGNRVEFILRL